MPKINLEITPRQQAFIDAEKGIDCVLFGGSAGGGKSFAICIDSLLFSLRYAGSRQLILRRSLVELEMSILIPLRGMIPNEICKEHIQSHTFKFNNGSVIVCSYLDGNSVTRFQGSQWDRVYFDELCHFGEYEFKYLMSRVRGTKPFPRCIKASANPGGVGHQWVKSFFIDIGEPNKVHNIQVGTRSDGSPIISRRIFLPSRLDDNIFLMQNDPEYRTRLESLPPLERAQLLEGNWDITEGQLFSEFSRELHVCSPFEIPKEWRRYRALDYGLDMLACLWIAVDSTRNVYVYKELHESNLPISVAAEKINDFTLPDEEIYLTLAPPDLWNRNQVTGRGKNTIFEENGLTLTKSNNDRTAGWLSIKELLRKDANGEPKIHIFSNCKFLIKNLPLLMIDEKNPSDAATEPHEITHICDALRYFTIYWFYPAKSPADARVKYPRSILEDWKNANSEQRIYIESKMGGKPLW